MTIPKQGSLLKYFKDPITYQMEMYNDLSEVTFIKLGPKKMYLFNTEEAVTKVLISHSKYFHKGMALQNVKKIMGENILTSEDQVHLSKRKLVSKIYSKVFVQNFEKEIKTYLRDEVPKITEGTHEAQTLFNQIALDLITILLFGKKIGNESQLVDECLRSALKIISLLSIPGYNKIIGLPLPHHIHFRKKMDKLNQLIDKLIDTKKDTTEKYNSTIDLLIEAGCSRDEIRSQVLAFFLAGHETTTTSLSWTIYASLKHKCLTQDVIEEAKNNLENDYSFTQMQESPLIKSIIFETFRYYPAVWNIGRMVSKDITINNIDLKCGDFLSLSPLTMQRSEKHYKNANSFIPTRWIKSDGNFHVPKRHEFFPFSHGPRNCIGQFLAEAEIFSILNSLFSTFEMELVSDEEVTPKALITLKPKNSIFVKFKKRR